MADYIMTAQVILRVKNAKDDYEAWEFGENFLTLGLESLAMSTDDEDDHFELEGAKILNMEKD
jgi:hypothetical protein